MTPTDLLTKIRHKVITDMCYTTRHDYGIDKLEDDHFVSGMTVNERRALYNRMDQLYDHHIKEFVEALFKSTYIAQDKEKSDAIAMLVLDKFK